MIEFSSNAGASVKMFDSDAKLMIKLMKHSGTIPGAIASEDLDQSLSNLQTRLDELSDDQEKQTDVNDDEEEVHVGTKTRAFPLIQLIKMAIEKNQAVMWHTA